MRILLSIAGNALALLATAYVVPGIHFTGDLVTLLVAGALLGLFNLVVRPVALLLSLPLLIVTLGLFYFVLNALLLWIAANFLLPGYRIDGFVPALLGSLVIAVVNWLVGALARGDD
jgi:putative membrane protein